jgi:hypothetical protein
MNNEFIVALTNLRKAAHAHLPPHAHRNGDVDVLIVQYLTSPKEGTHLDGLAGPHTMANAVEWIETKWMLRDPIGAPRSRR